MATPSRVVFLDIDGVLNTIFSWGKRPLHETLDAERVQRIRHLCDVTGSVVVISSSWRMLFSVDELRQMLALPVIGCTPQLGTGHRCDEIRFWVNSQQAPPDHFVIFDDDETAGIPGHFVWIAQ